MQYKKRNIYKNKARVLNRHHSNAFNRDVTKARVLNRHHSNAFIRDVTNARVLNRHHINAYDGDVANARVLNRHHINAYDRGVTNAEEESIGYVMISLGIGIDTWGITIPPAFPRYSYLVPRRYP